MTYSTVDVAVEGGALRVGRWSTGRPDAPIVLALHGITAHHLSWPHVADALDADLIAPDLRGRGRSREVDGAGLVRHADDAAAVVRAVAGDRRVVVVGHSMGAFIAMVLAERHSDLVSGVVLVDGGFPFAEEERATTVAALETIKQRLRTTFPSAEAYVELFRNHPAFVGRADDVIEEYARYDATGAEPEVHSSAVFETVLADQEDVLDGPALASALESLRALSSKSGERRIFLRAPRGFADDPPGLYAPETAADLARTYPAVEFRDVEDVNHYTIVLSRTGARAVADAVRDVSRPAPRASR